MSSPTQYNLFDYLKCNPIFANLDQYACQIVESYLSFKALEANDILFEEGDRGDYLAIVVVGKLDILKNTVHELPTYSPIAASIQPLVISIDCHQEEVANTVDSTNADNRHMNDKLNYETANNAQLNSDQHPVLTTPLPERSLLNCIATLKMGDSIGEMAIIDELARSATVRAVEKTGLIILPKQDFERILQDHPRIGINMLKGVANILSINLRRTSESLSQLR